MRNEIFFPLFTFLLKEDFDTMNLYNEQLRALRTAIERLNWMLEQPNYEDIAYLLVSKKEQYVKELENLLEDDF